MLYELHLTASEVVESTDWHAACKQVEVKPLYIELDKGEHPFQLMCAVQWDSVDLHTAVARAATFEHFFKGAEKPLRRFKLECPLDKVQENGLEDAVEYYEMHMKVHADVEDIDVIHKLLDRYPQLAHSWNLWSEPAHPQKHYLTQRAKMNHPQDAAELFADVYAEASKAIPPVRMEMEAVVLDTNKELDKGWCEI